MIQRYLLLRRVVRACREERGGIYTFAPRAAKSKTLSVDRPMVKREMVQRQQSFMRRGICRAVKYC
jgi:hypothetical protein